MIMLFLKFLKLYALLLLFYVILFII